MGLPKVFDQIISFSPGLGKGFDRLLDPVLGFHKLVDQRHYLFAHDPHLAVCLGELFGVCNEFLVFSLDFCVESMDLSKCTYHRLIFLVIGGHGIPLLHLDWIPGSHRCR
jgi:hypothetical protein